MQIDPDVRAFIESQRIARLATVDEHARPHVVPICFALDSDRRKVVLYSAVDEKPKRDDRLRRLRNIDANPSVQVLFDVYHDEDWSRLRYVQLRGRARIIEAGTRSNSEHTAPSPCSASATPSITRWRSRNRPSSR